MEHLLRCAPAMRHRALLLLCALPLPCLSGPAPAIPSEIWPQPVSATFGSTHLSVCAGFAFPPCLSCPAPLPAALARYAALTFFAGAPAGNASAPACLPSLRVAVLGDMQVLLLLITLVSPLRRAG